MTPNDSDPTGTFFEPEYFCECGKERGKNEDLCDDCTAEEEQAEKDREFDIKLAKGIL